MVVSPPEQWYDVRRFLVEGGYRQFVERSGRYLRKSNEPSMSAAVELMQSKPSHLDWYRQWCLLALNETEQACGTVPEEQAIRMFFKTANYAYCGDFREALQVVNHFRKAHNFTTFLGMPSRNYQKVNSPQVLSRSGELESGMDLQHPVEDQRVQKEYLPLSHKRTNPLHHTSAVETVQGKSPDRLLPKRRRTCTSPLLQIPMLPSVAAPMSQPTSQPKDSEAQAIDTQRRAGNPLDSQGRVTSRTNTGLLNSSNDPLILPAPGSSSRFETQVSSTAERMSQDVTLDMSSSTHMTPVLDHVSAATPQSSMLDSQRRGLASAYMYHPESHSSCVSISSEPTLEPQQATSALFWSPSPSSSERIDSEDTLVVEELDLSDSNHLVDGCLDDPWNWDADSRREPPWLAPLDPPSPPNHARPPGVGDTHFWSFPWRPSTERESVPLILPDFPPRPPQAFDAHSIIHKPRLPMAPPVWAQARQELCESLSYFRSYQGGVYSQKRRARGYLLDGHPAVQDLWHADGRCIISHAGGNSAIDRLTGQTVLIDDQTVHSASCNALFSSWKTKQPIVLIAGNGYNLFPYDLGNRSYVVLGYYWIIHAWEEPEPSLASPCGYFVRWKFMFQWIQSQGRPWWIPWDSHTDGFQIPHASLTLSRVCQACFKDSHSIYNFGWVCTRSECSLFFRRVDPSVLPLDASGFHPEFLTLRDHPREFQGLSFQIRPIPPVERKESGGREHRQVTTSRHFWKGWCCEKCGRLSCREYWTHWECYNCRHTFRIKSRIQPPPAVIGKTILHPSKASGISLEVRTFRDGPAGDVLKCHSFRLPWDRGVIHLLQAEKSAQTLANGIWYQYQQDAKQPGFFRRYSMKTHKLKGRMLSHYFSQNSGEPYEYVGGTDNTVPLEKHSSVSQAMAQIRVQTSLVLGKTPVFNEILSAAYMAEQKMEFHSDGEKDLGPIIASLSLGLPATMRFRPVPSRWYSDEETEGIVRKSPPIVLTLTLRHGDVLIMEGAKIQEYYQHAVHPWGFRIAATARDIQSENTVVNGN